MYYTYCRKFSDEVIKLNLNEFVLVAMLHLAIPVQSLQHRNYCIFQHRQIKRYCQTFAVFAYIFPIKRNMYYQRISMFRFVNMYEKNVLFKQF